MKVHKDKAIIIAFRPLKDADKLAICFTSETGKLALAVKGASKLTSKRSPSLDGGNIVYLSYYEGKSDTDLLLEIKLLNDLKDLKTSPLGINSLLYVLEILNDFIQPKLNSIEYFNEIILILEYMNSNPNMILMLLSLFQLRTLSYFGFTPLLDKCVICSSAIQENEKRTSSKEGIIGYICSMHFDNLDKGELIKDNVLKVQKYLLSCDINSISLISNTKEEWFKILKIQNNWMESILEKKVNSFDLLQAYE